MNIVIIGGGLAGLFSALQLNRAGFDVTLIERKTYPFHKVCGEYISNEVLPFLTHLNIDIHSLNPSSIQRLKITSPSGKILESKLDLGGFGISRYTFDHHLYQLAKQEGVKFILGEKVNDIKFIEGENKFELILSDLRHLTANICIGAYGKRSNIDQKLNREFFRKRSPYVAVKYHIRTAFPADLIQLDIFKNGYCGIQKIEDDRFCLCYLGHRDHLKKYGTIKEMEKNVLYKNPSLKNIFTSSEFLYDHPETINEISFDRKKCVEDHMLMCGDSAGMITPLCGNGMAMAIHSSKLLCDIITENVSARFSMQDRTRIEKKYMDKWERNFSRRLFWGRSIQQLFGNEILTDLSINILNHSSYLRNKVIKLTHGEKFI
jgi:menaquinone-9 beta-reductase